MARAAHTNGACPSYVLACGQKSQATDSCFPFALIEVQSICRLGGIEVNQDLDLLCKEKETLKCFGGQMAKPLNLKQAPLVTRDPLVTRACNIMGWAKEQGMGSGLRGGFEFASSPFGALAGSLCPLDMC